MDKIGGFVGFSIGRGADDVGRSMMSDDMCGHDDDDDDGGGFFFSCAVYQ